MRRFSVSIVIEWYNITRAKQSRAFPLLAAVAAQARELWAADSTAGVGLSAPLEIVVTYDSDRLKDADVERVVRDCISSSECLALQFVPVTGGTYLKQKNSGALRSTGEIIIFLDSDVIPEPGWLAALLKAFTHQEVSVAIGNTYVDLSGGDLYSKALAISWMFPLRDTAGGLTKTRKFYANNVGFRRETFLSRPFEDVPGLMHFGATRFVARLEGDGIPLWNVGDARGAHPSPNGVRHFVKRAVAAGRARALSSASVSVKTAADWIRLDVESYSYLCKRIVTDRGRVGLRLTEIPGAMTIAVTYGALFCAGSLFSYCFPELMRRRLDL